jgi:hypothetical protein
LQIVRNWNDRAARSRIIAAVLGVSILGASGSAAAVAGKAARPDFALTVSPTRMVVPSGQIGTPQHFQVIDSGRLPLDVTVSERSFEQLPDGAARFEADAPYSAAHWVTAAPDRFHLQPGGRQTVTVWIRPPANPEPGDHAVALVSSVAAPTDGAGIRINRGIGMAVYIATPGMADTSAEVTRFQAPWFALGGPITFTAAVHSTGTVHRDFTGSNGLTVDASGNPVRVPDFTVLRGATRIVTAQWRNPPFMCICHASVDIADAGGGISAAAVTVIVFPLQWFGAAAGAALLLFLVFWLGRRHQRKHPPQI